jgi:SAM-dependent methyltransferase
VKRLLDATARAEHRHFWFRGLRRFVRPLLARAVAGCGQPEILDCGCGTGANLAVLAELGAARGVEREWAGLQRARAAGRLVGQATVTHLPFGDAQFDLVTSFDVLYCLETPDERAAVSEMFRVLRPGERVVVNVAAMPVLTGNHSVLSHELRRYTARGLRALLEHPGFAVERLTYTNATMLPILLPLRLAHKALGLAPEEDAEQEIRVPAPPVNALLDRMLALEAAIVRHIDLPCGSSLLAMARKPTTR